MFLATSILGVGRSRNMGNRPPAPLAGLISAESAVLGPTLVWIRMAAEGPYLFWLTLGWAVTFVGVIGLTLLWHERKKNIERVKTALIQCPGCGELLPPWFIDPELDDVWQVNRLPNPNPPRAPWQVARPNPLYEDGALRRGQVFQVLACRVCRYKSTHYPGQGQSQRDFERWERSQR